MSIIILILNIIKYIFLVVFSLIALWAVSVAGIVAYVHFESYTNVVTDPDDPSFDINKFHFNNYTSEGDLREDLEKIFPVGTPKKQVDQVLGRFAKIDENVFKDESFYMYAHPIKKYGLILIPGAGPPLSWGTHFVAINYDQNNQIKKIKVLFAAY